MDARQVTPLRLRKHQFRVRRVHDGEEAVARAHIVPVARADPLVRQGVGGRAPGAVVLQPAAHVIGIAHVDADLVELAERQVAELIPVVGAVPADRDAAVSGQNQVVRVRGIDPERVVVEVHFSRRVGGEVAAAVRRAIEVGAAQVDPLGIVGVDADLAVVHGAIVGGADLLPGLAAVGGAVDTVLRVGPAPPANPWPGARASASTSANTRLPSPR